jgi:hypothetical protein
VKFQDNNILFDHFVPLNKTLKKCIITFQANTTVNQILLVLMTLIQKCRHIHFFTLSKLSLTAFELNEEETRKYMPLFSSESKNFDLILQFIQQRCNYLLENYLPKSKMSQKQRQELQLLISNASLQDEYIRGIVKDFYSCINRVFLAM